MRILIVNKFVRVTGGADQYCLALADHLRQRGHEVAWLSTAGAGNLEHRGAFVPCTVTHADRDRLPPRRRLRVAVDALWNRRAAAATRRLIEEFGPDVIHVHKLYPQLSVAPVVVAASGKVPIVQTLHDYELVAASSYDHEGNWYDADESRVAYRMLNTLTFPVRRFAHVSRVNAFIAVSDYVARVYAAHKIKATPVLNAVDLPKNATRGFQSREGIVFVGRLVPFKGVVDVLELARRVQPVPVTIAGGGTLATSVEAATADLPNLNWAGWLPHESVGQLLEDARVAVMPSLWQEPAPLTALEAMARGTPIVTYSSGGLGEAVDRSRAGRVVAPRPDALAAACVELHHDPAAWRAASRAGIAATRGPFSIDAWVAGIEAVYRNTVGND